MTERYEICTVDKPDPQFKISCPSIPGSKEVNTLNIKENTPTCEINETFKFIIPDEMKDVDSLPVVVGKNLTKKFALYISYIGPKKCLVNYMMPINQVFVSAGGLGKVRTSPFGFPGRDFQFRSERFPVSVV